MLLRQWLQVLRRDPRFAALMLLKGLVLGAVSVAWATGVINLIRFGAALHRSDDIGELLRMGLGYSIFQGLLVGAHVGLLGGAYYAYYKLNARPPAA